MKMPVSKHRPWQQEKTPDAPIASRKRDPFYHSSRWTKESRAFRLENPLCVQCQREDMISPSEVTDHKVPKNICADPWDRTNWEALCKKCHSKKGSKDRKYFKQKST